MKFLIIGLGLIGGSFAKALTRQGYTVYGFDKDESVMKNAIKDGAILGTIPSKDADVIIISLYPSMVVDYVKNNAFKKGALIIDTAGVKDAVCTPLFSFCENKEFIFIGGHPMAGTEKVGYIGSKADMFNNASMILVAKTTVEEELEKTIVGKEMLDVFNKLGFSKIKETTAEKHDEMIALTSQLAHVLSNAYVKSPNSKEHKGFSAGSFRDLTRVAKLNATMWTELFIDNKTALCKELDGLIDRLKEYCEAIKTEDKEKLFRLLEDGSNLKKELERE